MLQWSVLQLTNASGQCLGAHEQLCLSVHGHFLPTLHYLPYDVNGLQGAFRRRWDAITSLALLFCAFVTPYEVAFVGSVSINTLFVLNRIIDSIFLLVRSTGAC